MIQMYFKFYEPYFQKIIYNFIVSSTFIDYFLLIPKIGMYCELGPISEVGLKILTSAQT